MFLIDSRKDRNSRSRSSGFGFFRFFSRCAFCRISLVERSLMLMTLSFFKFPLKAQIMSENEIFLVK
jgi:hypothetical protein